MVRAPFACRSQYHVQKRDLWWVTTISPDGERHSGIGCGFTLAEAAADAWIGHFLPWGSFPDFSEEDCANVPLQVADGWQFELHAAPVYSPLFLSSFPIHSKLKGLPDDLLTPFPAELQTTTIPRYSIQIVR